jgi:nicotinamidase-related amidase
LEEPISKVGLIVVDVQKAFHESDLLKKSVDWSMYAIGNALQIFRDTGNPIFFIQDDGVFAPKGTPGFELSPALNVRENEYRITKRNPNGFFQTNLKEKLLGEKVEFVVICGLSAQFCVNATFQGAEENGFKAAILNHGIASLKETWVQTTLETRPLVSFDVLKYFLAK